MKVPSIQQEYERLLELGQTDGQFHHELPYGGSEFMSYIGHAVGKACKAYDYPWERGADWPLGFRFDGYYQDGMTFVVFFRIDKDCPFMVVLDGIDYFEDLGGFHWVAQRTVIVTEEV
jgi:hypothetical protein